MRILFAGTPNIAVPSLKKLNSEHEIIGVLTNPDKGVGRGRKIVYTPVKEEALKLNLNIFQPIKLDLSFIKQIEQLKPEILVVVAYGKIFKKEFLDIFSKGGLNMHPSLLPKYRGASPIASALLNGESETGISIQRLAKKMDSGAILIQEKYTYFGNETTESLTEYFSRRGADLLSSALSKIEMGNTLDIPQNEDKASYCSYIKKSDGIIDWNNSAKYIERKRRAFFPWPGIYTYFNDKKLNIIEANIYKKPFTSFNNNNNTGKVIGIDKDEGILVQTGEGILSIQRLQLQSKKALDWKAFLNGSKDIENTVLGGN